VDIFQTIIASGVVGAVVGSIASFLIIRWQQSKAADAAKGAARVVYLEVAQNIATLNASLQFRPVRFIVTRKAWDAHFGDLAALLPEPEIASVAAPYLQLDAYGYIFQGDPVQLLAMRLRSQDRDAVLRLTEAFRGAEATLRPRVWTGKRKAALKKAIGDLPRAPVPGRLGGLLGGLTSLPMWPFLVVIAALQAMSFIERMVNDSRASGRGKR
jgi:hypothetical protein